MQLDKDEGESTDNYEFDLKKTLESNILNIFAFFIIYVYVIIFSKMMNSFTLPEM